MANLSTTRSVAETLLTALQSSMVKDTCSKWGVEPSRLKDLIDTVSDIRSVLCDAEAKQELVAETRKCVQKLKDAVYDADDLFDELLTVAGQTKGRFRRDNKLLDKVRAFFSDNRMSQCVEDAKNQLDALGHSSSSTWISRSNVVFEVDYQLIKAGECDIHSYVRERNVIIGRKIDKNVVVDLLLDPPSVSCCLPYEGFVRFLDLSRDVILKCWSLVCQPNMNLGQVKGDEGSTSFLTIEGVRGVGKTALAQLVYNDERVKLEFPLRLWVDICNGEGKQFKANAILGKILEVTGRYYTEDIDMLKDELSENIGREKYLIVLDDVCVNDPKEWLALREFLMFSIGGSRIIVTTCYKETTRAIGSEHTYELKGLSKEYSWLLFKKTAFGEGQEQRNPELVEIGKKIVEICDGIPLAIKELGSLLFGQDISKLSLFEKHALAAIGDDRGEDKTMSILKLSYHSLESPLKSCLSYCALFPKGFIIDKKMLLNLWTAQGYVVPLDGQSMVDSAEEYFSKLLLRCLLQPVKRNKYGEVVFCKMHSLMHDVALDVGAQEICVVDSIVENMADNIIHLHHIGSDCSESIFPKIKLRSYIHGIIDVSFPPLENLVSSWIGLRALDLHGLNIRSLPESIGKLLHLRYLDVSDNHLERLPNSITKLHNLQTLNLEGCTNLEELPWDLYKLVNLSSLNISKCLGMFSMPSGMDRLTCLHTLTAFVVAEEYSSEEESSSEEDSSSSREQNVGMLKDLKALIHLRGSISILIPPKFVDVGDNQSHEESGGYLGSMEHLKQISIEFEDEEYCDELAIKHEDLLEKLQPHSNLKGVVLRGYQGATLTRWTTNLPNLVKIKIDSVEGLQHLSYLSQMQHLKSLTISGMGNLKYMEMTNSTNNSDCARAPSNFTFFPSLEELSISYAPELTGWWEGDQQVVAEDGNFWQPAFLRLFELSILTCPKLALFPPCPRVEIVHLGGVDENFKLMEFRDGDDYNSYQPSAVRKVNIFNNIGCLESMSLNSVTSINITWDHDVETLSQVKQAFKNCSSSLLRKLTIKGCDNLKSISGALEYLTVLESLSIIECPSLIFKDDDDMPWRSLHQSLRSLELWKLESMTILPRGIQYLTALQELTIECCWELKDLPEWIGCLSSLKSLRIKNCDEIQSLPDSMRKLTSLKLLDLSYCKQGLKERCQNPTGEDWPKIQHVPFIIIYE